MRGALGMRSEWRQETGLVDIKETLYRMLGWDARGAGFTVLRGVHESDGDENIEGVHVGAVVGI
jgi:hypothetical protein